MRAAAASPKFSAHTGRHQVSEAQRVHKAGGKSHTVNNARSSVPTSIQKSGPSHFGPLSYTKKENQEYWRKK